MDEYLFLRLWSFFLKMQQQQAINEKQPTDQANDELHKKITVQRNRVVVSPPDLQNRRQSWCRLRLVGRMHEDNLRL